MMKKKITRMSESGLLFEDLDNTGNSRMMGNNEVRTGSITPTTFSSRELYDLWYQDIYTYNHYSVAKFGIN